MNRCPHMMEYCAHRPEGQPAGAPIEADKRWKEKQDALPENQRPGHQFEHFVR
jgi:hypothetical protein